MKKYLSAIFMMCLMLVSSIAFTACDGDDQLDTNQYKGGVSLNVFGPSPVARGGILRFIGSGMDQVTAVVIPGTAEITDINKTSSEEISVVVPQDAQPGYVILRSPKGDITTLTKLTYTEPVGFDVAPFSPATIKPGQVLAISGEYLNLVTGIEFTDGVLVEKKNFTAQTRTTIDLVVPFEAQTGKVALTFCATGDTIPNVIMSDAILTVVLPAVAELKNIEGSKPGDVITIEGTDFDLVETVLMPNGEEVQFAYVAGADGAKDKITFTLPASISAGSIRFVPASGVEVPVALNGVAEPAELAVSPAKEIRAGNTLVVTGKNLDVVTNVNFPGVADAYAPIDGTNKGNEFQIIVPEGTISGEMKLNTGYGVQYPVAIETAKPALTAYNPATASAGSDLTITGENLDLIKTITFAEGLKVSDFVSQSANEIVVTIPVTAVSGDLTITMTNGETVTFSAPQIDSPVFCFIPVLPTEDDEIKAGSVMTVNVVNGDKLTDVEIDGAAAHYILTEDVLMVGVPTTAGKKSIVKLISSNGSVEYNVPFIPNTEITQTLWEGEAICDDWGNQPYFLSDAGLELAAAGVVAGDIVTFFVTPLQSDWKVQIIEGHWGETYLSICAIGADTENGKFTEYDLEANKGQFSIVLTQEMIDKAMVQQWWGGTFLANGDNLKFTKITTTHYNSLETTIWEGSAIADDWGNQPYVLSDGGAEFAANEVKAGQTIRFYLNPLEDAWKLQVVEGHWGDTYCSFCSVGNDTEGGKFTEWDLAANKNCISFVLTQAMIDKAMVQQWWGGIFVLNGDNVECYKITVE